MLDKLRTKRLDLYVLWLAVAGLLVYVVIENHPYSYYTLLRWIWRPVFAYSGSQRLSNESCGLDLDFWSPGWVKAQLHFPRPFRSEHLDWTELVHHRCHRDCRRRSLAEANV